MSLASNIRPDGRESGEYRAIEALVFYIFGVKSGFGGSVDDRGKRGAESGNLNRFLILRLRGIVT